MKTYCMYCDEKNSENIYSSGMPLCEYASEVVSIFNKHLSLRHFCDDDTNYYELDRIAINYCPICGRKI